MVDAPGKCYDKTFNFFIIKFLSQMQPRLPRAALSYTHFIINLCVTEWWMRREIFKIKPSISRLLRKFISLENCNS
jgi:hypothetical protein